MTPESDVYEVYPEFWTHIITLTFGGLFIVHFTKSFVGKGIAYS